MVFPQVLLRVLPDLVVVLALDGIATDTLDLLHALIVREWSAAEKARGKVREIAGCDPRFNDPKEE